MADRVDNLEPQSAADYDDRTTRAVRSVLVEIGQLLRSFNGKYAIVGGAVPWIQIADAEAEHVGTLDVDLALDAEALADNAEYTHLIQALLDGGYRRREKGQMFQLEREVSAEDGEPVTVVIDLLMPRNADIVRNKPALLDEIAVMKAYGVATGLHNVEEIKYEAEMPRGGINQVELPVISIPALLAMKGWAVNGRDKSKDSYDIHYCVKYYAAGLDQLVEDCSALMKFPEAKDGYAYIRSKFRSRDSYGPNQVRLFVQGTRLLEEMDEDQWQTDAFEQVNAWLEKLGI